MKNIFTLNLLCFGILTLASDNNNTQREKRLAVIKKVITTCEKEENTCLSIFATSAAAITSYFCAHAYKPKNNKSTPMLIHYLRSKTIPRVSGMVGATSFLAWLVINSEKMSWERDAYDVWLETHPQPAPLNDNGEDPFDIRHY